MKSKLITYPAVIMLMIIVPVLRYYSTTENINACVIEYVDNMEKSDYKWYMYDINWVPHIEAENSTMNKSLIEFKIWESNWCIMSSNNLFSDLNNTFYCTVVYLIKHAPVDEKYKTPLWVYKWTNLNN